MTKDRHKPTISLVVWLLGAFALLYWLGDDDVACWLKNGHIYCKDGAVWVQKITLAVVAQLAWAVTMFVVSSGGPRAAAIVAIRAGLRIVDGWRRLVSEAKR